jgi:sodium/bile acid cotransporter 7
MAADSAASYTDITSVSATELVPLVAADAVVIVDVRPAAERAVSMIPGAVSAEQWQADRSGGRRVVAYCTAGYRSGDFARDWRAQGVAVENLAGGILAWLHADQPVVDSRDQPTRRVHVYGRRWNLLPPGYEGVW